ncbi:MAG: 16S rRNA (cytosine(967)-C(5))-methyltransferase RsmB [Actinomycetota bacterium]|nr:16S rRNA (cytosine(967)-C(5))-methyltransferase RsmB [Actinomycetota bacterium]
MPDGREIAYELTRRVNSGGGYLNLLLRHRLQDSGLDARERALTAELAYGIQRHRNKLDYIIASFSARPIAKLQPGVLDLLRLGVYQLSQTRIPVHASVNETVEIAKRHLHPKAVSYINAVLREAARNLDGITWPEVSDLPSYLETVRSHPRWLVEYMLEYLGDGEAEALCEADNLVPTLSLRLNIDRTSREEILTAISGCGGSARTPTFLPEALVDVSIPHEMLMEFLDGGLCVVQDESSMLVSHVVDPQAGEIVIDACAAPGGKATHLAQLGGAGCTIFASDINPRRLEAVRGAVERLDLGNIRILEGDSRHIQEMVDHPVDAVLLDAPCSGLGTLRRRPELKWRMRPENVASLSVVQARLLDSCAGVLRPGGRLVYSVCTFTHEETIDVIDGFLGEHGDFVLEDLSHLPGEEQGFQGYLQIMPHLHGMEGMFIAHLGKIR